MNIIKEILVHRQHLTGLLEAGLIGRFRIRYWRTILSYLRNWNNPEEQTIYTKFKPII